MRDTLKLLSFAALTVAVPDFARAGSGSALVVAQAAQASSTVVDGEVQKIDKDAGKITLKHGPIPNLEMPGMTMVFRVKDPAMLDSVKPGDKVRFSAEKSGGSLTVTQIAPAK